MLTVFGASGVAAAETPPQEPTLKVEVNEKLAVTGKLTKKGGEAPFDKCRIGSDGAPVGVPKGQTIGPFAVDAADAGAVLLRHALAEEDLQCLQGGSWRSIKLGPATAVLANAAKKGPVSTSVPIFAPSFAWELGSTAWGKKVLSAFGTAKSCSATAGDGKEVGCTLDTSSGDIKFSLASKITSGQVVLHLERGSDKPDITIPVDACRVELRGDLPFLVAGGAGQRITLAKQSSDRSCSFLVGQATKIVIGQNNISLSTTTDSSHSANGEVERDAGAIPEGVTAGVFDAEVHGPSGPIAVARIDVVSGLKAADKLFVEYDRSQVNDPFGQFEAASGEADGRNAVVNPAKDIPLLVANATDIVVPPQLPVTTGPGTPPRDVRNTLERSDLTKLAEQRYVWAVRNAEGGVQANFAACDATRDRTPDGAYCVFNDGIGSVKFAVSTATEQPIKPVFLLVRLQGWSKTADASKPPEEQGRVWTATTILRAPVELAKSARRESIALPIRTLLEVECLNSNGSLDAKAFANDTKGIDEEAVRQGRCKLRLSRQRVCAMSRPDPEGRVVRTDISYGGIDLYWRQFVKVTIQRGGTQKTEVEWLFKMPDASELGDYCDAETGGLKTQAAADAVAKAIRVLGQANAAVEAADAAQANAAKGADESAKTSAAADVATAKTKAAAAKAAVEKAQEDALKANKAAISAKSRLVFPELTLPAPSEPSNATQVYSIEAKVEITPSTNIKVRGGTLERASGEGVSVEHSHLRFVTYLRPRGLFGWRCCVRTYITATTQLGGLRFPAEPRELRNSSQSPDYQFVAPRLGVLASLEGWNYNEGVDPVPLNPTFQFGAHFLNLSDGTVELSTLVGGAFTVPLVSDLSSQLGTKVTVGAYWEHNFLGKDHLLLSLSLNIGSLLSGSQK